MEEYGSYNWYGDLQDPFFKNLCIATQHADFENVSRLAMVFPHILAAKAVERWEKAPDTVVPVMLNVQPEEVSFKEIVSEGTENGSFNWYLKRSGSFVTAMANVILYADVHNREMLRMVYPQMISAFEMEDWDMCPSEFSSSTYNGVPDA